MILFEITYCKIDRCLFYKFIGNPGRGNLNGGNFDLRPKAYYEKQLFEQDISVFYAKHVNNLDLKRFSWTWKQNQRPFFAYGIECINVKDLSIRDVISEPDPGNTEAQKNGYSKLLLISGVLIKIRLCKKI